jgi:hypothetical protein
MTDKIGFGAEGKCWEGPITLLCDYDTKSNSIRYFAKLKSKRFEFYPPEEMLGISSAEKIPMRILVTIQATRKKRVDFRFPSEIRADEQHAERLVYAYQKAMVNSVKYIRKT